MFTCSALLALRPAAAKLDSWTRQLLNGFGLARRGRRAGCHTSRHRHCRGRIVTVKAAQDSNIAVINRNQLHLASVTNIQLFHGRREDRVRVLRPVSCVAHLPPVNIGVLNACSVGNKSANIADWIVSRNLKLAAVVETWHDSHECPTLIACAPPGYHFIEKARVRSESALKNMRTNHGGVCLFYHGSLHARRVSLAKYTSFEYVCVYISGSTLTILIIVLYRPGSEAISDLFFSEFSDLLEHSATYAASLVIAGDVNIHLDDSTDNASIKFQDVLSAHGLVQHVSGATHRSGHCLDVFITRDDLHVRSVIVDPPLLLSDHSSIVCQLDLLLPQNHTKVRRVQRSWRSFDYDSFMSDLSESKLVTEIADQRNVNELFALYDGTLKTLLDKHAPTRTVEVRAARTACWYDAECRQQKKETRRLEKIYRCRKSPAARVEFEIEFRRQRKLFQKKLSDYWVATIDSCKNDVKALWSKVRTLMTPPVQQDLSHLKAADFQKHFTSKVEKIRSATASAPQADIEPRSVTPLSTFSPVTTVEIIRLLSRIPTKHCSLDPVPTWLVKRAADILAPVLCAMCNASLVSGEFPSTQKLAIVAPRLKKPTLDADDVNSYRPISNLSFASKLVERVVASRYREHVERQKLFPARQSAYRRHHSTETAVVCVVNDIIRAIDKGKVSGLVLLDLSAAFDTVDHPTLLNVLHSRFGFDDIPLTWINSYISDRTQVFIVNGEKSEPSSVDCSVPQVSVLGPLEFISYTEDVA